MHETIIRSWQGRTTAAEEAALGEWRRASPRNEKQYRDIVRLWALTGRAGDGGTATVTPPAAAIIGHATRRAGQPITMIDHGASRASRAVRIAWRLAAAVLLLASGVAAGMSWLRPTKPAFGVEEFVTDASQMVSAQLADGSVVRLAPHSRLRIANAASRRDIWLDGRAFFAVAKDAHRPFVVHTSAGNAVALGTRFEVNVRGDALTLVMLQGRVALSANGASVEVHGGEVSAVARGAVPTVVKVADVRPMLTWVGEFLAFEATPLAEAASEIGGRYGVQVQVHGPELAHRTVTAWFTDESLPEVIAVVCRVADARCEIDGANVDIWPREEPARRSSGDDVLDERTFTPASAIQKKEGANALP